MHCKELYPHRYSIRQIKSFDSSLVQLHLPQLQHLALAYPSGGVKRRLVKKGWLLPKSLRGYSPIQSGSTTLSAPMSLACSSLILSLSLLSFKGRTRSFSAWRFIISLAFSHAILNSEWRIVWWCVLGWNFAQLNSQFCMTDCDWSVYSFLRNIFIGKLVSK